LFKDAACLGRDHHGIVAAGRELAENRLLLALPNEYRRPVVVFGAKPGVQRRDNLDVFEGTKVIGDGSAHGEALPRPALGEGSPCQPAAGDPFVDQHSHRIAEVPGPLPFRVIAVLDILRGQVVHARGGDRAGYGSVSSVLGPFEGPVDLAGRLRDRLGLRDVYVADLDALESGAGNLAVLSKVAGSGLSVWADVGLRDAGRSSELIALGITSVVAATETLSGPSGLFEIIERIGPDNVVFGLDLRNGVPLTATGAGWRDTRPEALVEEALNTGVARILLLDLARVGSGRGVGTLGLVNILRRSRPRIEIVVGGGVSGLNEILAARDAGADGVLIASALHDGRIGADELARIDRTL
jgi:phosphoribosylformimino-5-aminoimidazole carboxamide ribotide isomerase